LLFPLYSYVIWIVISIVQLCNMNCYFHCTVM